MKGTTTCTSNGVSRRQILFLGNFKCCPFLLPVLLLLLLFIGPPQAVRGQSSGDSDISPILNSVQPSSSYFLVASRIVRPGQTYKIVATVYNANHPITVRASIQRDGVQLASHSQDCDSGIPEELLLKIPPGISSGNFKLHVEGNHKELLEGSAFVKEANLQFMQRSMTIFITTDKPVYMQGQTVKFRCVPITTDLRTFSDSVDVYMVDPNKNVEKRWLSRQSNLGAVSLEYPLSSQPIYGNWTIRVVAQGQEETKQFVVEEFYQTRFEVNVSMPAFFLSTDDYIYGSVMANFTSGIPVTGNLTMYVAVDPARGIGNSLPFEESIKMFDGFHRFMFKMSTITRLLGGAPLDGARITVKAIVGERFLNLVQEGFSRAFIFGSKTKLQFLGGSPQVFKPQMPIKAYLSVSYQDGSQLTPNKNISTTVNATIRFFSNSGFSFKTIYRSYQMSLRNRGIWEIYVDPKLDLNVGSTGVEKIHKCRIEASYNDQMHGESRTAIEFYSSFSPTHRNIQVSTSTQDPRVGEFIVFRVRSSFHVDQFSYIIASKGIILTRGRERMSSTMKTFSVTLSPEMAPSATIVTWTIARGGEVIADALQFPVDGISRNNFTLQLNTHKDKTGETVEVMIYGQPGTYVGLSALDKDLHALDVSNQINHADVMRKMNTFDMNANASFTHVWVSRDGELDKFLHFPSPTLGIDTDRTFELADLIIITDANITRRPESCASGEMSCLSGDRCYRISDRCNQINNCPDGSDERGCPTRDLYGLGNFRMTRNNRLLRVYENSWLWKDINIGPLGYYIFNVPVPKIPATWLITSFGISNIQGFGVHSSILEYSSTRPFFMNLEMPSKCTKGEQIGLRISIFNYMNSQIEVLVKLAKSPDYKFVHVEAQGVVSSYAPRTFSGEHQHIVWIPPQKAKFVHIPIVSTKLGNITVTVTAETQVAKTIEQKTLYVESDGIPVTVHSSTVLDLSQGTHSIKYLDTNLTDTPIIPLSPLRRYIFGSTKAIISVTGDVVGPAFPSMPLDTQNLLHKPYGCAEQNMFNFAANMYTLLYLRLTGQRNSTLEKQAFLYLNIQYQRQLSYQNEDGSFRVFRFDNRPSVWLTAFCVRIFQKATFQEWELHLHIDRTILERAIGWLLKQQLKDGSFQETAIAYDRKMNESSKLHHDTTRYRRIPLTAHVVIALSEVQGLRGDLSPSVATAKLSAAKYLEDMLDIVKTQEDPYELAIVTYALTKVNAQYAETAFNELDKQMKEVTGMRYWGRKFLSGPKVTIENNRPYLLPRLPHEYDVSNVETTAYALLTYIRKAAVIRQEIVEWLNTNRLHTGGWGSTQDSIIALQALVDYATTRSRTRDITNIEIVVEAPSSPNFSKRLEVKGNNLARIQTFEIPNAYGPVIIRASGAGVAIVQMDVHYNVDWEDFMIKPPLKAFSLDVKLQSYGRNNSHINYRACSQWTLLSESKSSGMAVLDLTLPTGYVILQQDLDKYVKSKNIRNLREARYEERKVYFYFDYLDSNAICVSFTVQRWYPVANISRFMPARVYDYYAPERFEEVMVSTYDLYRLSICHVCGSYQCPYCPIYSGSRQNSMNLPLLIISLGFVFSISMSILKDCRFISLDIS